jgi:hypothetical protein
MQSGAKGQTFAVRYPGSIWAKVPPPIRAEIARNIAYAGTHFVPLMLKRDEISYEFPCPSLESFWFQNTLRDLPACELADGARPGLYVRSFFNQATSFKGDVAPVIPALKERSRRLGSIASDSRVCVPFTFGKESMLTLALMQKFGLVPVLLYSEEPSHPYELAWKSRELKRLSHSLGIDAVLLRNSLGGIRYGKSLGIAQETEIGWGAQTTQLAVLAVPLFYSHGASSVLIGNECTNNEAVDYGGWRAALSFDQSSEWTVQQSLMTQALSGGGCRVYSSLEPLQEMAIFFLLQHYFPELGKKQFSCSAQRPLFKGSQWCHSCYKCARMFLFARCTEIDPFSIGFKRDLLAEPGHFDHYFGKKFALGSEAELDFSFLTLERKGLLGVYRKDFLRKKRGLPTWESLLPSFVKLQSEKNLPPFLRRKLLDFFRVGLRAFERTLSR